jgi:hypothetical protein
MASSVSENPSAMVSWLYRAENASCALSKAMAEPSFLTGAAEKPDSFVSSSNERSEVQFQNLFVLFTVSCILQAKQSV